MLYFDRFDLLQFQMQYQDMKPQMVRYNAKSQNATPNNMNYVHHEIWLIWLIYTNFVNRVYPWNKWLNWHQRLFQVQDKVINWTIIAIIAINQSNIAINALVRIPSFIRAKWHPKEYPDNIDEVTTIDVPAGSRIELMFNTFDLEEDRFTENYRFDFVEIKDGYNYAEVLRQDGRVKLPEGNEQRDDCPLFHSDTSVTSTGFSTTWKKISTTFLNPLIAKNHISLTAFDPKPLQSILSVYRVEI